MSRRGGNPNSYRRYPYPNFSNYQPEYIPNDRRYQGPINRHHSSQQHSHYRNPSRGRFTYRRSRSKSQKERKRSPSPLLGTEEYTQRKIALTSELIMKQLENPTAVILPKPSENEQSKSNSSSKEKVQDKMHQKKRCGVSLEEVENKLFGHLRKLNYRKTINFINSNKSDLDNVIIQIQKQKRLELSRALRDMYTRTREESASLINSIIPDFDIPLVSLPSEFIEKLSESLNCDTFNPSDLSLENPDIHLNKRTEVLDGSNTVIKLENTNEAFISDNLNLELNKNQNFKSELNTDSQEESFVSKIKEEKVEESNIFEDIEKINFNETTNEVCIKQEPKDEEYSLTESEQIQQSCEASTQTLDEISVEDLNQYVDRFFEAKKNQTVQMNLDESIQAMLSVDKIVARLTEFRQNLFRNSKSDLVNENAEKNDSSEQNKEGFSIVDQVILIEEEDRVEVERTWEFEEFNEKILLMEVVEKQVIVGTDKGKIVFFDLTNGRICRKIDITSVPITALQYTFKDTELKWLFIGCSQPVLSIYDSVHQNLFKKEIEHCIQCFEICWNYLFMGTQDGNLLRFSLNTFKIENSINVSTSNIFALKATREGCRKVILIASRNSEVTVRDALSGLYLRTMSGISTTVYSLLLDKCLVYCGTPSSDVLVFSFNSGKFMYRYNATNSKAIGCMKIVGKLLFASCFDGNIYIYLTESQKFVEVLKGPGGVITSMGIFQKKILISTLQPQFVVMPIPESCLEYLKDMK